MDVNRVALCATDFTVAVDPANPLRSTVPPVAMDLAELEYLGSVSSVVYLIAEAFAEVRVSVLLAALYDALGAACCPLVAIAA